MELSEVVARRRMVRNTTDEPVDPAVVRRILDLARRAPSAGFSQGQRFVVVTEEATRRRIAELADEPTYVAKGFDPWLSRAPVHVVPCADERAYRRRYAEDDKVGPDAELCRAAPKATSPSGRAAPKATSPSGRAAPKATSPSAWPVPYWHVDAGASLMLLLLAVVEEGLAAGFAGVHGLDGLADLLGIPAGVHPLGVVTIGHPAPDRRSGSLDRGWRPLDDVVAAERWTFG